MASSEITTAEIFSAVSAAAAALSLIAGAYKYWRTSEAERVAKWQSVVVYAAVAKALTGRIAFDSVRAKYADEIVLYRHEIPKDEFSDQALLAALMNLMAKGLVTRDDQGFFGIAMAQPSLLALVREQDSARRAGDMLLTMLLTEEPKTPQQLRVRLEKETGSSLNTFTLMTGMIRQGFIVIQSDGKIHLAPLLQQLAGSGV